jgi:hypothetical protein
MKWLLQTTSLPNLIIIIYWASLSIPLIIMYILEAKYAWLKWEKDHQKEIKDLNNSKTKNLG